MRKNFRLVKKLSFAALLLLLTMQVVLKPQVTHADISTGLTAYYSFDDISGTTVPDSSGNGYDGTITGSAVTTTGVVGDALTFDGSDDTVDIPHQLLSGQTPDFSYSFYIKADVDGDDSQYILAQASSGTNNNDCFSVAYDNSAHSIKVLTTNNGQNAKITKSVDLSGDWTHIAVTHSYSENQSKLYVNGVAQTGFAMSCSQELGSQFLIGRSPWAGYNQQLKASLDEVRVYSRVLTDEDVYTLATEGDTNTVALTSPTEGQIISGSADLEASTSGSPSIDSIQYYANGEAIGDPETVAPYTYSWDTTALDQGDYAITALGTDSNGDPVPSPVVNVEVDNPPQIKVEAPRSTQQTSTHIVWVTDEPTTGQVEYGTTDSYGQSTTEVSDLTYYHDHEITGLLPNTTYHYQISSLDNHDNEVTSGDQTFTTITDASGNEWHVTTDGTAGGDGSESDPWDLATALAGPDEVQPGDTIWVHGGTYDCPCTSSLSGSVNAPIIVRNYNDERAIIDGGNSNDSVVTVNGQYAWFWGLEVINSDTTRTIGEAGSNPVSLTRGIGFYIYGIGTRFINNIVHDTSEGFGFWTPSTNSELYGNIVYYNGWDGPDRGHGHGLYVQNDTGIKYLANNVVFKNFDFGLHAYTQGGRINNIQVDGNTFFDPGALSLSGYTQNMLLGGYQVADNPVVINNAAYTSHDVGVGLGLGYIAGCTTPTVQGNYVASASALDLSNDCSRNTIEENTFYGGVPGSSDLLYPDNDYYNASPPAVNQTFIRPNVYETDKTYVTIFNWQDLDSVSVDLSSELDSDDTYAVYDVQNMFGDPIASGTFDGSTITIPMTSTAVADVVGDAPVAPEHSDTEFGSFIIKKTGHYTPPAEDDNNDNENNNQDNNNSSNSQNSDSNDSSSSSSISFIASRSGATNSDTSKTSKQQNPGKDKQDSVNEQTQNKEPQKTEKKSKPYWMWGGIPIIFAMSFLIYLFWRKNVD